MSARRTVLTVAAAAVAVAVMSSVGIYYSLRAQSHGAATKGATTVSASDRMKAVLLTPDLLPAGSQFQEFSVQSFAAQHGYDAPQGMTFTPASCLQYDQQALGNPASYPGWIQFGVTPASANSLAAQFSNYALSVAGGVDLARIQTSAATCASGTLSVPSMGVTATVSLGTYATPTFAGAKTLGITITTTFSATTPPEVRAAVLGQCEAPADSTVADTSACHDAAMKEMANTTTDTRYAAYVVVGDVLAAACAVTKDGADQTLATLYQRALTQLGK